MRHASRKKPFMIKPVVDRHWDQGQLYGISMNISIHIDLYLGYIWLYMLIYAYICLYTSCIWVIYVFFLVWYIIIMGFGNLHKCDGRFHWIESGPEKMIMGMDDRIPRCHSDSFVFAAGLGTTVIVQIAFISSRFVWKYETVYTVLHPTILCSIILTYTYLLWIGVIIDVYPVSDGIRWYKQPLRADLS